MSWHIHYDYRPSLTLRPAPGLTTSGSVSTRYCVWPWMPTCGNPKTLQRPPLRVRPLLLSRRLCLLLPQWLSTPTQGSNVASLNACNAGPTKVFEALGGAV